MNIRSYQSQDFDAVIALYKNKTSYGGNYDKERDQPESLNATGEAGNLYVAETNQGVVGTLMILDNPHSFWVIRFAVDPNLPEAKNIEDALIYKAKEKARSRNHASIIIYTNEEDTKLNQRYASLGFHKGDLYRSYWKEVEV